MWRAFDSVDTQLHGFMHEPNIYADQPAMNARYQVASPGLGCTTGRGLPAARTGGHGIRAWFQHTIISCSMALVGNVLAALRAGPILHSAGARRQATPMRRAAVRECYLGWRGFARCLRLAGIKSRHWEESKAQL